jgi:multimeric flavodoxin WrbA
MNKAIAINGSPLMDKGNTGMVLTSFTGGLADAGVDVEVVYPSKLKVKPCSCGQMHCWRIKPGECCIKDEMESLYPKLKEADTLILATPVYIPLPGDMQIVVNRLCPLIIPVLETRRGRTRATFRADVNIKRIVLVSTGGWWEKGNFEVVVHIAQELAENTSVEFAGAVLRPHAFLMGSEGELSADGKSVLDAARKAGYELAKEGAMADATLDAISRPLIPEDELRQMFNQAM